MLILCDLTYPTKFAKQKKNQKSESHSIYKIVYRCKKKIKNDMFKTLSVPRIGILTISNELENRC